MRKIILILLLLSGVCLIHAQTVTSFQDLIMTNNIMPHLDSVYPSAMHAGKPKGVFRGRKLKKFEKAWGNFYEELMKFFCVNNFKWNKETWCFNKVYFTADGKVDYWLYNFRREDSIPQSQQNKFRQLVTEFCKTHTIHAKAPTPFSQCASVTFVDVSCSAGFTYCLPVREENISIILSDNAVFENGFERNPFIPELMQRSSCPLRA